MQGSKLPIAVSLAPLLGVLHLVSGATVWAGTRAVSSLNGAWDMAVTRSAELPGPDVEWQSVTVPKLARSNAEGGSRFGWFRRQVTVPADWQGNRVFLYLSGARYHPRVFVDGRFIGEQFEGWTPFEIELTHVLKPGTPSRVDVCCQDWGATFADGYQLPETAGGDLRRDSVLRGKLLAPIGGHYAYYGIWDDAELRARPAVYLDEAVIDTSVRNGQLSVSGGVAGAAVQGTVSGVVLDAGKTVLELPAVSVSADAGWTLSVPFPNARYWSPEDPHLYQLELTLRTAPDQPPADVCVERFGFRELWAEGSSFVLNGVKRHLLATSGWPATNDQTAEQVRSALQTMKDGNNVAFRLHTQPWQRKWLEQADEVGIMIIEEGALWCDGTGTYAFNDDRFWQNVRDHLAGMVRRDRNHACLVMWSIENELLHCGASRHNPDAEQRLAELGAFVRAMDPAHLITFESDHDPKGAADVIGLHYPHEMPANTDYPNTADWLDRTVVTGTGGELLGSRRKRFRWTRQKPLYIGEYLWVPYQDYSPGSVFFGDLVYTDRIRYHREAQALAWTYQTQAYRRAGVSGLCPWTIAGTGGRIDVDGVLYQAQKAAYEPVAAFPREVCTRYFSGERITRTFDVFNDSVRPLRLELQCFLDGRPEGTLQVHQLEPATYRKATVQLQLPATTGVRGVPLTCRLSANGNVRHTTTTTLRVYPLQPVAPPEGTRLLLYDPRNTLDTTQTQLTATRIDSLEALASADVTSDILLVAPKTFRAARSERQESAVIGRAQPGNGPLRQFLQAGGRMLVLEQESMQDLPFGAALVPHASTMTFPSTAPAELLANLDPDDLKFWRPDHYVSRRELRRPGRNGARSYIVSGGEQSLAQAAMAEVKVGRGTALLCQALVGTKLTVEPAARLLLRNAIRCLADRAVPVPAAPTLLLTESAGFADRLARLGVSAERVDADTPAARLRNASVLLVHGAGPTAVWRRCVREFAAAPGNAPRTVYWHAPTPGAFTALKSALGLDGMTLVPARGPVVKADEAHPVFTAVLREDLTYAGAPSGRQWMRGFAPDPTIIDHCLAPASERETSGRRLEAEHMTLEGHIVLKADDGTGVNFATTGKGTISATVQEAGLYRVDVVAGGSSLGGVFPTVVLAVNGEAQARVALAQAERRSYPTVVPLPQGEFRLSAAFVNDQSSADEDRNLFLDALVLGRAPLRTDGVALLTRPPAVAVAQAGGQRGGAGCRVVVDLIRWDRNKKNAARADRYASALLANLGASFAMPAPEPEWILPDAIEPVGEIPYFRKTAKQLSLVAAGTVSAQFDCVKAGVYDAFIRARSDPAEGTYAIAALAVDGHAVGEVEIANSTPAAFPVGQIRLGTGQHRLTVAYTNDLWREDADRNLFLNAVGFRRVE